MTTIGIFDSGVGGLTVLNAVRALLPEVSILYFADTAFFPYGEKSVEIIQARMKKIISFFKREQCDLIIIACHSASSAIYNIIDELEKKYNLAIINMIDPTIDYILNNKINHKKIGLIGTRQTVQQNIYAKKINNLFALATPELANAIETEAQEEEINHLLKKYLENNLLKNINLLILACTHYPIIKNIIKNYYNNKKIKIIIIDPALLIAKIAKEKLQGVSLGEAKPQIIYYATDLSTAFIHTAQKLFNIKKSEIKLGKIK